MWSTVPLLPSAFFHGFSPFSMEKTTARVIYGVTTKAHGHTLAGACPVSTPSPSRTKSLTQTNRFPGSYTATDCLEPLREPNTDRPFFLWARIFDDRHAFIDPFLQRTSIRPSISNGPASHPDDHVPLRFRGVSVYTTYPLPLKDGMQGS